MMHPFWILNSSLLLGIIINSIFIMVSRVTIVSREDIEPSFYSKAEKDHQVSINLKHIYENDLFDSYKKQISYITPTIQTHPLPQPPRPMPLKPPVQQKPMFLDPLNLTLRGIIIIGKDEARNRAIISDNKTDLETLYKVGDKIQDAQLIRIFNNKIVLLRANGQQEIVYMRNQDAQSDPRFAQIQDWHSAIKMINKNEYSIIPEAFIKRVENLAHLIELLHLTTAYEKGKPIGTHVGIVEAQSIGFYLGLQSGDLLVSINEIPIATTTDRLKAYQTIINGKSQFDVIVTLIRNKKPIHIVYHVQPFQIELIKHTPIQEKQKLGPSLEDSEENRSAQLEAKTTLEIPNDLQDEIAFSESIKAHEAFLLTHHERSKEREQEIL